MTRIGWRIDQIRPARPPSPAHQAPDDLGQRQFRGILIRQELYDRNGDASDGMNGPIHEATSFFDGRNHDPALDLDRACCDTVSHVRRNSSRRCFTCQTLTVSVLNQELFLYAEDVA